MRELLAGEGVVRVRVAPEQVPRPRPLRSRSLVAADHVVPRASEPGWLTVQIAPDRTADVNRTLAEATIYASGLESGNDLEELFLSLTTDAIRGRSGRHVRRPGRLAASTTEPS